jgi:hypothetical protein
MISVIIIYILLLITLFSTVQVQGLLLVAVIDSLFDHTSSCSCSHLINSRSINGRNSNNVVATTTPSTSTSTTTTRTRITTRLKSSSTNLDNDKLTQDRRQLEKRMSTVMQQQQEQE